MHGYWLLHGYVPDLGSGYGTTEGGQAGVSCRLWRLGRSGQRKRKEEEEGEQGNRAEAQSRAEQSRLSRP